MAVEPWRDLIGKGRVERYPKGSTLLRQGTKGDCLLFLQSGLVRVVQRTADGREISLAMRGAGELLGDMSVISGEPRNADVIAMGPCTVVHISAACFLDSLRSRDLVVDLLRKAHTKQHESDLRFCLGRTVPLARRFAHLLVGLVNPATQKLEGWAHVDLAQLLGVKRRVLGEELKRLREAGVLVTGRRLIEIKKMEVLRALADGSVI
ncbi:Crp/Fnr family transcriptional regulator [Streptomyces alboflavus]|uniref:Crp/Fnr family transcriptional regulator n=1 Tax=Streptomyces alboflavus TaxID=67267 RepID=UPI0036A06FA5